MSADYRGLDRDDRDRATDNDEQRCGRDDEHPPHRWGVGAIWKCDGGSDEIDLLVQEEENARLADLGMYDEPRCASNAEAWFGGEMAQVERALYG